MESKGFGLGIAKGMALTFKHLFRRPITVQYPEERLPIPRRFRGYEFVWDVERCTGCATCAKSCPHGVIEIVSHSTEDNRCFVDRFRIDRGLCMSCGLCVEACPFEALHMGSQFEGATYSRNWLIIDRDSFIAAEKHPSAYARPKFMVEEMC